MKRIAINYDVVQEEHPVVVSSVIDDSEFAHFIAGKQGDLSATAKKRLRTTLRSADARVSLFLAAYAQKNMDRLARLMRSFDSVDKEIIQEWRLKTMDTGELLDLYTALSADRSRSVRELLDISGGKPTGSRGDPTAFLGDDEDDAAAQPSSLSKSSREKVTAFYDRVVVKKKEK